MKFKSKIDWWFHAVVVLLAGVTVLLSYLAMVEKTAMAYVAAGIFLLLMGLAVLPIYWHTVYILEEKTLLVFSGLHKRRIAYADMLEVTLGDKISSAPALSLDRIQIRYHNRDGNQNFCIISPKNQEQFADELARNTGLGIQ